MDDKLKNVSMKSRGGNEGTYEIAHLTCGELNLMDAMLNGAVYISTIGGRIRKIDRFHQPPAPVDDPLVGPYWPSAGEKPQFIQRSIQFTELPEHSFPSITIQHLCGYNWSEANYKIAAKSLESYGFECLRSRRGDNGEISEIWYLGSLILAEGELGERLKETTKEPLTAQVKAAIDFLCRHVQFGTLDVAVQRAAMRID